MREEQPRPIDREEAMASETDCRGCAKMRHGVRYSRRGAKRGVNPHPGLSVTEEALDLR